MRAGMQRPHGDPHLIGGRASKCEVYPTQLCEAILRGLKNQLTSDGTIVPGEPLQTCCVEAKQIIADYEIDEAQFVDDISGETLNTGMVRAARAEEMRVFEDHNVYTKVPIDEAWQVTGKGPIGTKWIDINKGDLDDPDYRSRLVAQELKQQE